MAGRLEKPGSGTTGDRARGKAIPAKQSHRRNCKVRSGKEFGHREWLSADKTKPRRAGCEVGPGGGVASMRRRSGRTRGSHGAAGFDRIVCRDSTTTAPGRWHQETGMRRTVLKGSRIPVASSPPIPWMRTGVAGVEPGRRYPRTSTASPPTRADGSSAPRTEPPLRRGEEIHAEKSGGMLARPEAASPIPPLAKGGLGGVALARPLGTAVGSPACELVRVDLDCERPRTTPPTPPSQGGEKGSDCRWSPQQDVGCSASTATRPGPRGARRAPYGGSAGASHFRKTRSAF